jgi:hypothetical protein
MKRRKKTKKPYKASLKFVLLAEAKKMVNKARRTIRRLEGKTP